MRDLTFEEIMLVVGGEGESGSNPPVVVTGHNPSGPGGQPTYPPGSNGGGGGTPVSGPSQTPAAKLINGYTKITIGRHNLYVPPNPTAAEQQTIADMKQAITNIDYSLSHGDPNAQITITEQWKNSSGVTVTKTVTESASDFKSTWNSESFALVGDNDFNNYQQNNATNQTGRGSASIGSDPDSSHSSNNLSAFAIDSNAGAYDQNGGGIEGMQFLTLHETSHLTAAGKAMNSATMTGAPSSAYNDFTTPMNPNLANENAANTMDKAWQRFAGIDMAINLSNSGGYQANTNFQTAGAPV